jgi:hypothetical protein
MLKFPCFEGWRLAFVRAFLAAAVGAAILGSCGGSSNSAPAANLVSGAIETPIVINLYPNQSAIAPPRLVVMATSVGSAYGSTDLRAQNGNIGYAQLTLGDAQGQIKTAVMPVFLYYSITDVATGQALEVPSFQRGIFGVASTSGTIVLPGSVEPSGGYPACATDTNSTCYVVGALKYLQYGDSVSAGFMLSPAQIRSCDITTAGSCAPASMLTIGLNSTLKVGFSTVSLPCPPNGYVGPASIAGYPVCQKTIDNTTVMVSGNTLGTIMGGAVFDTGTANMQIATPAGSSFPSTVSIGSSVLVTTSSGFAYSYITTNSDPLATIVNADCSGSTIVGIGYLRPIPSLSTSAPARKGGNDGPCCRYRDSWNGSTAAPEWQIEAG